VVDPEFPVKRRGGIITLGVISISVDVVASVQLNPNNSISVVVIAGRTIVVTVVIVTYPVSPLEMASKVSSIVSVLRV